MDRNSKVGPEIEFEASSAGDCTGLIPSGVNSASEIEAYNEVYSFLPKAIAKDSKKNKQSMQADTNKNHSDKL